MTGLGRETDVARGVAVGLVGSALAVLAHVAGGGTLAPTPLLVTTLLLGLGACVASSGRRWTTIRAVVALGGLQLAVHVASWSAAAPSVVDPRLSHLTDHTTHVAEGAAHGHGRPTMLVAHLLATVIAAVAVDRAERVLLVLWDALQVALGLRRPVARASSPPRPALGSTAAVVVALGAGHVRSAGSRAPPSRSR